ncbi:MAG TPA: putative quinol monooxygenase [Longimicrobium sp.]|nr:putative quinol monooxygenase [Longimicrobium sp.]
MVIGRREFLAGMAAFALAGPPALRAEGGASGMYGLIGKMRAVAGQRDALIAILLEGTGSMPGCLSYVVATDPADADAIWITEVWDSEASHKASLQLPAVRDAISRGRPLIAGFDSSTVTTPVGGEGLPSRG